MSFSSEQEEVGAFPRANSDDAFTDGSFSAFNMLEIVAEGGSAEESMSASCGSSEDERNKKMQQQVLRKDLAPASASDNGTSSHSYKNLYSKPSFESEGDEIRVVRKTITDDKDSRNKSSKNAKTDNNNNNNYNYNYNNKESTPSMATSSDISVDRSHMATINELSPPPAPNRQQRYMVRHTLATSQQVTADPATMLENLFIGLEQERQMHKLTAQHLRAVNNWFLFLPSFTLALISGIAALVSQTNLDVSDTTRIYYSIFVGIVALMSVFWQAVAKQLDLGSRASLHDSTTIALKRLSEDILLTLSATDKVPSEYVALTSEKLGQALDGCRPCVIPLRIQAAFSALSDRMVLMLHPPTGQAPPKQFRRMDFTMRLYATAFDELTTEIIHHWAWPFALPRPRAASDAALRNFKELITEGREASRCRGGVGFLFCHCLGEKTQERSLFDVLPAASVASAEQQQGGPSFVRKTRGGMSEV
jgi:hypothetical protein